jgi:hypothetical protein
VPLGQFRGDMGHPRVPVRLRSTVTMLVAASAAVLAASAAVLAASAVVLGAPPVVAAPVVLPSPCPLAPLALVAPALGVSKAELHPVTQSGRSDGFALKTCVFAHGADHVTVTLAPAAFGSGGASLPGLVTSHPAGLGSKGTFLQDARPGLVFASAVFVKGPLWGEAYSNAHVAAQAVLTLGRYVYSHMPPG